MASGADAAAGLVTAILAGLVIAGLGGASYQISGPTGAMSAVLIVLAQRYGLAGLWVAGLMAGVFLLLLGLFRLGRYHRLHPLAGDHRLHQRHRADHRDRPDRQLPRASQRPTPRIRSLKLLGYFTHPIAPDWHAVALAADRHADDDCCCRA